MSDIAKINEWFRMRYRAAKSNGADDRAEEIIREFTDWETFRERPVSSEGPPKDKYLYDSLIASLHGVCSSLDCDPRTKNDVLCALLQSAFRFHPSNKVDIDFVQTFDE